MEKDGKKKSERPPKQTLTLSVAQKNNAEPWQRPLFRLSTIWSPKKSNI